MTDTYTGRYPWQAPKAPRAVCCEYSLDAMGLPSQPPRGYEWVKGLDKNFTLVEKGLQEGVLATAECQPLPPDESQLDSDYVTVTHVPDLPEEEEETAASSPPPPPPPPPSPYLYHTVDLAKDTLFGLSLRYNVPVRTIRSLNSFSGDLLSHAPPVLKLPVIGVPSAASVVVATAFGSAEEERRAAVFAFANSNGISEKEAKFYLSASDYDEAAAEEELRQDREWASKHDSDFTSQQQQQRGHSASSASKAEQLLKKEKGSKPPLELEPDDKGGGSGSVLSALKQAFGKLGGRRGSNKEGGDEGVREDKGKEGGETAEAA